MKNQTFPRHDIKVLNVYYWINSQTNTSYGGRISQVTHCSYNGIPFYVRENNNGVASFLISSSERMGDKVNETKIRKVRQALELLAPPEHWDKLADIIRHYDPLRRAVLKNIRFNSHFIKRLKAPEKDKFSLVTHSKRR